MTQGQPASQSIPAFAGTGLAAKAGIVCADVLDTSLSLRRPERRHSSPRHALRVHIEEGRGLHGEDPKPFEARLDIREGKTAWSMRDAETAEEIAKSGVHRMKQKIEREGGGGANSRGDIGVPRPPRLGEGTQGQREEAGLGSSCTRLRSGLC
jgi:hypothetical protein